MIDPTFKIRNKTIIAEPKAEEYLKVNNIDHVRYGIDALHTDIDLRKVPPFIMNAPDFIVLGKDTNVPYFLEVKGFKGTIKIKEKDIRSYRRWDSKMGLIFFIYDTENNEYCKIFFIDLMRIIRTNSDKIPIKTYPENRSKKYYDIPKKLLPDFDNF
tara:strand:- start:363 stop:833 length:471 start_codon:yes stop_codon:yes gene_type:complete